MFTFYYLIGHLPFANHFATSWLIAGSIKHGNYFFILRFRRNNCQWQLETFRYNEILHTISKSESFENDWCFKTFNKFLEKNVLLTGGYFGESGSLMTAYGPEEYPGDYISNCIKPGFLLTASGLEGLLQKFAIL